MRDGRFEATSIAEIAAAADITRSAFYFYFASKEALLERLIETTLTEFIDRRLSDLDARDAPPAERLRRLLHGVAEMWVEHGVVLSAAAELAASVPALFDRIAGVIASGVETLTPVLAEHDGDTDPVAVRETVSALLWMGERTFYVLARKRPVAGGVPRTRRPALRRLGACCRHRERACRGWRVSAAATGTRTRTAGCAMRVPACGSRRGGDVVPRWEDVVALDDHPDHRARGPVAHDARHGPDDARVDGEEHAGCERRRSPAALPRVRGGGATCSSARPTLLRRARRGRMDVCDFAGPFAARTSSLLGLHARAMPTSSSRRRRSSTGSATTPTTADTWERCERANRLVDEAITVDWDPAEDGTVLRALVDAGTYGEDEIRANVKLFISGGLNEPRDLIATDTARAARRSRAGGARARGPREPRAGSRGEPALDVADRDVPARRPREHPARWRAPARRARRIGVLIASANRDERHWEDPDRFDLRRATVRHMAFSRGPHVCPGAYVARQQVARAALPPLLALPGIPPRLGRRALSGVGLPRSRARLDVTWKGRA